MFQIIKSVLPFRKSNQSQHTEFRKKVQKEYSQYIQQLFFEAWQNSPFGLICTILRVQGCFYGHWDPFEESKDAFDDYNPILEKAVKSKNKKLTIRIGLLMYCHLIEMTSFHKMLANLLYCKGKKPYIAYPFSNLHNRRKGTMLFSIPPGAKKKVNFLKEIAKSVGDDKFESIVDSFFNEQIRNAFVHSDYCLTEDEFHMTEGGPARVIKLSKISEIVTRALAFYEEMFRVHKAWKLELKKVNRFHKLPNYEVMELIFDEKDGLCGFKMHFSNGSSAHYIRSREKSEAMNLVFERDGTINFQVGLIDELGPVWKVNGKPVSDWDGLNKYAKN